MKRITKKEQEAAKTIRAAAQKALDGAKMNILIAAFVEGFLTAADTDGTGDEMIKDMEESPLPWGAPWLWGGKGWQPQAGESWYKAGARWYKQNAEEIRELIEESEEV